MDAYAEAGFTLQANQLNSELTGPFQDGAEDIAAEMANGGDVAGAFGQDRRLFARLAARR